MSEIKAVLNSGIRASLLTRTYGGRYTDKRGSRSGSSQGFPRCFASGAGPSSLASGPTKVVLVLGGSFDTSHNRRGRVKSKGGGTRAGRGDARTYEAQRWEGRPARRRKVSELAAGRGRTLERQDRTAETDLLKRTRRCGSGSMRCGCAMVSGCRAAGNPWPQADIRYALFASKCEAATM